MVIKAEQADHAESVYEARVNLAAAYRLTDMFGMTTLVYNHITARVPGTTDEFFINEFGLGYNEVTASNLVRINLDGRVLEGGPTVNLPGYVIHSAVHAARHDVHCVMHTHTRRTVWRSRRWRAVSSPSNRTPTASTRTCPTTSSRGWQSTPRSASAW